MTEGKEQDNAERDVATLRALGSFFLIMGFLVLLGTFAALGNVPAVIVNLCSAAALVLVGGGMLLASNRIRSRLQIDKD